MRLIDADALMKEGYCLERIYQKDSTTMVLEKRNIENVPIVDAVEVVRCRDCKWYKTMYCKMDRWTDLVTVYVAKKNDYCSYGEWRENDAKKTNRVGDDRKI